MALDNLISTELSQAEIQKINDGITMIREALKDKVINLTPEERRRYGRVNYEMIPWVQKCHAYMKSEPGLVPPYIDMGEFDKDIKGRDDFNQVIPALRSVFESMDDTMLLIGNDIYFTCIAFYKAVKSASLANVPGSTSIYQDLAQQFPGRPKSKSKPEPNEA